MTPDPAWEAFAAREPYFAVLTDPQFLRANLTPERERGFFANGEEVVAWMLGVIDAGLAPQFAPISTLEYGCGVGRLAIPLARRPGYVAAVDRSPAMLDFARREAERRAVGHIEFQTPAACFSSGRTFELVVCYHVLQRLRPPDGVALVGRLLDLIAPDGIGVFQWPRRTGRSRVVRASRWLRERLPGANALTNRLRGASPDAPFIPTHTYQLERLLPLFENAGFGLTHVVFEQQEALDYTILFAKRSSKRSARRSPATVDAAIAANGVVNPSDVSDEEMERAIATAETYFSALTNWEHHLAKPFSQVDEAPPILVNVATVLQMLRLTPGMSVVDFGGGTGWLSRFLSQLGCRVTLLDVSPTALRIAQELYRRQPLAGNQPAPQFLQFDGRHVPLPDESVDRIIFFDAFHHAPNPDTVIRACARVLKPGGIIAFAEPGPRHADAPRSKFEVRTYGVVEKDVDVHAVWRSARASGFVDIRMCIFNAQPHHVSLDEFENFLAGGGTQEAWVASTRTFLRHIRGFFLVKGGTPRADSRSTTGLACEIHVASTTVTGTTGQPLRIEATVTNSGTATWLPSGEMYGGVFLGAHLYDANGALLNFDFHTEPLTDPPRAIAPGETVRCVVTLPPLDAGVYRIELDCVAANVTWFALIGSLPVTLTAHVQRAEQS